MSVNDNFASRIFLPGLPVRTTGSNIGDTGEVDEPAQSGPINSAWWSWTAPSTGIVTFDTQGSNFDTWLSVYSGSALNSLSLIDYNDDVIPGFDLTSQVSLNAVVGETYQIAVDGWSSNTGDIQLNITAPPPPNDNFASLIALTGDTANSTGSNHGATGELGEHPQSGPINSAWWSWTAPSDGDGFFQVDTIGSDFDTWLSVFTNSVPPTLPSTLIGADDDSGPGLTSLYNLNATAGTTYPIAVDGFSNYTLGSINLNIAPTAPPNDNFANRIGLAGQTANATGSNIRATGEVDEPTQSGETNSVWWTWTAPNTGNYTFNTIGSGYDTWLSLFTGNDVSSLSLVAFNDDSGGSLTSRIDLAAQAGQTYQIAVEGYSNRTGQINLNIAPTHTGSGNLSETANNTLKEEGKDTLTGADTTSPYPRSSARMPVADITNIEKTDDLLTEGGAMINPPRLFSPAVNSAVPTLVKGVDPMFTDANGALAGNPALGINSALFGVANTSPFPEPNLVGVYQPKSLGLSVA